MGEPGEFLKHIPELQEATRDIDGLLNNLYRKGIVEWRDHQTIHNLDTRLGYDVNDKKITMLYKLLEQKGISSTNRELGDAFFDSGNQIALEIFNPACFHLKLNPTSDIKASISQRQKYWTKITLEGCTLSWFRFINCIKNCDRLKKLHLQAVELSEVDRPINYIHMEKLERFHLNIRQTNNFDLDSISQKSVNSLLNWNSIIFFKKFKSLEKFDHKLAKVKVRVDINDWSLFISHPKHGKRILFYKDDTKPGRTLHARDTFPTPSIQDNLKVKLQDILEITNESLETSWELETLLGKDGKMLMSLIKGCSTDANERKRLVYSLIYRKADILTEYENVLLALMKTGNTDVAQELAGDLPPIKGHEGHFLPLPRQMVKYQAGVIRRLILKFIEIDHSEFLRVIGQCFNLETLVLDQVQIYKQLFRTEIQQPRFDKLKVFYCHQILDATELDLPSELGKYVSTFNAETFMINLNNKFEMDHVDILVNNLVMFSHNRRDRESSRTTSYEFGGWPVIMSSTRVRFLWALKAIIEKTDIDVLNDAVRYLNNCGIFSADEHKQLYEYNHDEYNRRLHIFYSIVLNNPRFEDILDSFVASSNCPIFKNAGLLCEVHEQFGKENNYVNFESLSPPRIPHIRRLHVKYVLINWNSFASLISNCNKLEELELDQVIIKGPFETKIIRPTLQKYRLMYNCLGQDIGSSTYELFRQLSVDDIGCLIAYDQFNQRINVDCMIACKLDNIELIRFIQTQHFVCFLFSCDAEKKLEDVEEIQMNVLSNWQHLTDISNNKNIDILADHLSLSHVIESDLAKIIKAIDPKVKPLLLYSALVGLLAFNIAEIVSSYKSSNCELLLRFLCGSFVLNRGDYTGIPAHKLKYITILQLSNLKIDLCTFGKSLTECNELISICLENVKVVGKIPSDHYPQFRKLKKFYLREIDDEINKENFISKTSKFHWTTRIFFKKSADRVSQSRVQGDALYSVSDCNLPQRLEELWFDFSFEINGLVLVLNEVTGMRRRVWEVKTRTLSDGNEFSWFKSNLYGSCFLDGKAEGLYNVSELKMLLLEDNILFEDEAEIIEHLCCDNKLEAARMLFSTLIWKSVNPGQVVSHLIATGNHEIVKDLCFDVTLSSPNLSEIPQECFEMMRSVKLVNMTSQIDAASLCKQISKCVNLKQLILEGVVISGEFQEKVYLEQLEFFRLHMRVPSRDLYDTILKLRDTSKLNSLLFYTTNNHLPNLKAPAETDSDSDDSGQTSEDEGPTLEPELIEVSTATQIERHNELVHNQTKAARREIVVNDLVIAVCSPEQRLEFHIIMNSMRQFMLQNLEGLASDLNSDTLRVLKKKSIQANIMSRQEVRLLRSKEASNKDDDAELRMQLISFLFKCQSMNTVLNVLEASDNVEIAKRICNTYECSGSPQEYLEKIDEIEKCQLKYMERIKISFARISIARLIHELSQDSCSRLEIVELDHVVVLDDDVVLRELRITTPLPHLRSFFMHRVLQHTKSPNELLLSLTTCNPSEWIFFENTLANHTILVNGIVLLMERHLTRSSSDAESIDPRRVRILPTTSVITTSQLPRVCHSGVKSIQLNSVENFEELVKPDLHKLFNDHGDGMNNILQQEEVDCVCQELQRSEEMAKRLFFSLLIFKDFQQVIEFLNIGHQTSAVELMFSKYRINLRDSNSGNRLELCSVLYPRQELVLRTLELASCEVDPNEFALTLSRCESLEYLEMFNVHLLHVFDGERSNLLNLDSVKLDLVIDGRNIFEILGEQGPWEFLPFHAKEKFKSRKFKNISVLVNGIYLIYSFKNAPFHFCNPVRSHNYLISPIRHGIAQNISSIVKDLNHRLDLVNILAENNLLSEGEKGLMMDTISTLVTEEWDRLLFSMLIAKPNLNADDLLRCLCQSQQSLDLLQKLYGEFKLIGHVNSCVNLAEYGISVEQSKHLTMIEIQHARMSSDELLNNLKHCVKLRNLILDHVEVDGVFDRAIELNSLTEFYFDRYVQSLRTCTDSEFVQYFERNASWRLNIFFRSNNVNQLIKCFINGVTTIYIKPYPHEQQGSPITYTALPREVNFGYLNKLIRNKFGHLTEISTNTAEFAIELLEQGLLSENEYQAIHCEEINLSNAGNLLWSILLWKNLDVDSVFVEVLKLPYPMIASILLDTYTLREEATNYDQKLPLFKRVPEFQIEFLTNLQLKNVRIKADKFPRALAECRQLENINLDKITVEGNWTLEAHEYFPELKSFYFEQIIRIDNAVGCKYLETVLNDWKKIFFCYPLPDDSTTQIPFDTYVSVNGICLIYVSINHDENVQVIFPRINSVEAITLTPAQAAIFTAMPSILSEVVQNADGLIQHFIVYMSNHAIQNIDVLSTIEHMQASDIFHGLLNQGYPKAIQLIFSMFVWENLEVQTLITWLIERGNTTIAKLLSGKTTLLLERKGNLPVELTKYKFMFAFLRQLIIRDVILNDSNFPDKLSGCLSLEIIKMEDIALEQLFATTCYLPKLKELNMHVGTSSEVCQRSGFDGLFTSKKSTSDLLHSLVFLCKSNDANQQSTRVKDLWSQGFHLDLNVNKGQHFLTINSLHNGIFKSNLVHLPINLLSGIVQCTTSKPLKTLKLFGCALYQPLNPGITSQLTNLSLVDCKFQLLVKDFLNFNDNSYSDVSQLVLKSSDASNIVSLDNFVSLKELNICTPRIIALDDDHGVNLNLREFSCQFENEQHETIENEQWRNILVRLRPSSIRLSFSNINILRLILDSDLPLTSSIWCKYVTNSTMECGEWNTFREEFGLQYECRSFAMTQRVVGDWTAREISDDDELERFNEGIYKVFKY